MILSNYQELTKLIEEINENISKYETTDGRKVCLGRHKAKLSRRYFESIIWRYCKGGRLMDINKLMQQAQAMQKQLEEANKELNAMKFEGSASNGLVKVVVNGEYKITSVNIDSSILNADDKEMIQDLIMIATNEASSKVDQSKKDRLGSMTQGLKF